ncbi:hypothetical protein TREES_T100005432 [Tupaia chinensis]|uniref:Uncharacterized protein n=1 Tax=Tupaia chinensis TaxID=246437 RepID=L9KNZ6_TUPCH|nr:hypothetical protein TREES_T100005432 [Tupaia chinensis]
MCKGPGCLATEQEFWRDRQWEFPLPLNMSHIPRLLAPQAEPSQLRFKPHQYRLLSLSLKLLVPPQGMISKTRHKEGKGTLEGLEIVRDNSETTAQAQRTQEKKSTYGKEHKVSASLALLEPFWVSYLAVAEINSPCSTAGYWAVWISSKQPPGDNDRDGSDSKNVFTDSPGKFNNLATAVLLVLGRKSSLELSEGRADKLSAVFILP